MIDRTVKGSKTAVEQHHVFPRGYLATIGIKDLRDINQIVNFAVVEWPGNLKISDQRSDRRSTRRNPYYFSFKRGRLMRFGFGKIFWGSAPERVCTSKFNQEI